MLVLVQCGDELLLGGQGKYGGAREAPLPRADVCGPVPTHALCVRFALAFVMKPIGLSIITTAAAETSIVAAYAEQEHSISAMSPVDESIARATAHEPRPMS